MDWLMTAVDMFLHVDQHLLEFASAYGVWIYALLFLIVFLETGCCSPRVRLPRRVSSTSWAFSRC
jgi:hypothetical protein